MMTTTKKMTKEQVELHDCLEVVNGFVVEFEVWLV